MNRKYIEELDSASAIAESLAIVPSRWKQKSFTRMAVRAILIWMVISIAMPSPYLLACACSEVVVGGGVVTSSMSVNKEKGTMDLVQADIELPGVIPIKLIRTNNSGTVAIGIFGSGWSVNLISYLDNTSGDIRVVFPGNRVTFKAEDGYVSQNKKFKLTFTSPEEITVEEKGGDRWIFSTLDQTLTKYIDANGNEISFTWKVINKVVTTATEFNTRRIYCPLTVTYPGDRVMTFNYDTEGDFQYLCRSVGSPSGFTVSYSYTDELLTGISKSNGQVLSYAYDKVTDLVKTTGRLTNITYANAAEVNISYGQVTTPTGNNSATIETRVFGVSGPEGYSHTYDYPTRTVVFGTLSGLPLRVTELTDSRSNTTQYVDFSPYKAEIDALGNRKGWTETLEGLVTTATDKRGKVTLFTYDSGSADPLSQRNLITKTDPLGNTWTYTWDSNGKLTKFKDPLNHEVNMSYDSKGNLITIENGSNQIVLSASYSSRGELASLVNARGGETGFEYNEAGFLTKMTDPAGKEWALTYDIAGNLIGSTNPLGKTWTTTYNGFYKPSTVSDPLGNTTSMAYDEMANLTTITDANGNEVSWTYDELQRITSASDALNNTTTYVYDSETNLTNLIDALGRVYSFSFDANNQTKTFAIAGGGQESYSYDANGNLLKLTNRAGQEIGYIYNDASRIIQKKYEVAAGDSTTFDYSYNSLGRVTGILRKEGVATVDSISCTRDYADLITSFTANGATVEYEYDLSRNLTKLTYPSLMEVKYEYDSRNLISVIKSGSDAEIATYGRDDVGRIAERTFSNGLETIYLRDDVGRVTKIVVRECATPSNLIQSSEYGYDFVGNRLWVRYLDGKGDVYKYDAKYQIIGVKYGVENPMDGYDAALNPVRTVTYSYDAVGNRASVTENGAPVSYSVNSINQYTSVGVLNYSYSLRGDLVDDGIWTYDFDHEGHLIRASKTGVDIRYKYDAVGRRVEKNVDGVINKYIYSGNDIIEITDGSGQVLERYVYESGIDRPIKMIKGGSDYFIHSDILGSVTALTDSSGAIVEEYTYDVFGQVSVKAPGGAIRSVALSRFLFCGREFDAEIDAYHYRARTYSPSLGRFLSPDPLGLVAGGNLYSYVENCPTQRVDPFGKNWLLIGIVVVGVTVYGLYKYVDNAVCGEEKGKSYKTKMEKLYEMDLEQAKSDDLNNLLDSANNDLNKSLQNLSNAAASAPGTTASGPPASAVTAEQAAAVAIGAAANEAVSASGPSPQR